MIHEQAITAVQRMFNGLESCDFIEHSGICAMRELRRYGADMATDIIIAVAERNPTSDERAALEAAFPRESNDG